jgi:exonuclease SbcC
LILKNVEIRDFRSHRRTVVDFDEGISVIVGDNGSGKTSILESVNFALFKQKPNVNMDDLIRRGADEADVSVTFIANGRTFRATRGRKTGRAHGSALYRVDGGEALIVKGEDEITKEIEGILGIGGELFTSAVYIKQGEIDSLVSEQAAKRKEHVGKLLGADELERAHIGMGELLKEYRIRAEGLKDLPEKIKETGTTIGEKKDGLKTLKKDLKDASKVSRSAKRELKEVQAALKKLEQLKNLEYEKTIQENKIENLQEKIKEIEKNEAELSKTQKFHERYTAIGHEMKSLGEESKRFYELQERGEGLGRELRNVENNISNLGIRIAEQFRGYNEVLGRNFRDFEKLKKHRGVLLGRLETRAEKIDKKIKTSEVKISSASEKNKETEGAIIELKKAGAECPVCKGPLDKKHKGELLLEYSQKIEKNLKEGKKWESELEELRKEEQKNTESLQKVSRINLDSLELQIEQELGAKKIAEKIKSDLKANKLELKELSGLEKLLKKKEREKSNLEGKNNRFIAAKSYLRKYLPEKEDFQKDAKKIEKLLLKLERDIKKFGGPLERRKFDRLKQNESGLQEGLRDARVKEGKLESDVNHIKDEISSSEKLLSELKSKEKERGKLSKFLVLLEDIRRLFHKDVLQKDLRTRALPLIESYTKEIFDMFDLPYTDLELTDDFNVVLYGPHGEESVDMLSGGERIAAALALRMGIAKALSGSAMELIILDEPTIHLDSQRRQDLVEIIKKLSIIPQTIVVTHDKEFEQAADKLIVVEKVDGISKVS